MRLNYFVGWHLARLLFRTLFRWRVYHWDRVPPRGPVILAANHASLLDPPLVGAATRRDIHYLARDSLFRNPVFGWVLRSVNCVPVDREGGSPAGLKAIVDRVQAGNAVLLFPEGTRTRDGQLQPARAGIGLIVIRCTAPVVPVRVFGTFEAWPRHARWPRPHPVVVKFGLPLDFSAWRRESETCSKPRLKEIYREVATQILQGIAELTPHREVAAF